MTKHFISLRRFIFFLMILFFVATVLVPAAIVNKVTFIIMLMITLLRLVLKPKESYLCTISPIIIIAIFIYGFGLSFLGNSDQELAYQFLFSVSVLFLIYLIRWYEIDLDGIVKLSGILLSVFTAIYYFSLLMPQYGDLLLEYFVQYSLGAKGEREFFEKPILMFHLGTVPFLFLPLSLFFISFLKNKRLTNTCAIVIIGATIMSSASRGLILMSIVSLLSIIFFRFSNFNRILFILFVVPMTIFLAEYFISSTNVFSFGEVSNEVKVGHVVSFIDNLSLAKIIFGEGLASYYFSYGRNEYVAHTEITPLDMIRYLGFIFTSLLYVALLFPSMRIKNYLGSNALYMFIFILYLILSLTNPIFFNSYGLLILLWYWSKILAPCWQENKLV